MNSAFVLPHKTRLHAVRGCVHKTYTCNASNDKPKPPPHIKMTDREVIQIDSDSDEDEDLRRAIALSLQDADAVKSQTDAQPEPEPEPPRDKVVFGALQLDRKKMEEERLQRLGKRPRATSDTESSQTPPAKRVLPEDSKPKLQYPEGTVKRTWARGYPRTGEDIKIEEVFKPQELQLAVLSSFQWDEEWLLKKIDIRKTKVLLLASAPDEQTVRFSAQNLRTHPGLGNGDKLLTIAENGNERQRPSEYPIRLSTNERLRRHAFQAAASQVCKQPTHRCTDW